MSTIQVYESQIDKDFDILNKEFEITTDRLYSQYHYESALTFLEASENQNNEQKSSNKFTEFIGKIIRAISNFITDGIEMVQNIFSSSDNLKAEDFLRSNTGEIMMAYDMDEIQKEVEAEARKGRKLVQMISRGTNIDDKAIADFCDNTAGFIMKHGKTTIKVAAGFAAYKGLKGFLGKEKGELNSLEHEAESVAGDPEKEHYMTKVVKKMQGIYKDSMKVVTMAAKELANAAKTA